MASLYRKALSFWMASHVGVQNATANLKYMALNLAEQVELLPLAMQMFLLRYGSSMEVGS